MKRKFYLSSLTVSMVTAITLTTGLLLISNNSVRATAEQSREVYISFLFYLAAPLLIIISNIISVTIISSKQEKASFLQLELLGTSRVQIAIIMLCESLIYSIVVLTFSIFFNLIIVVLISNIANYSNLIMIDIGHMYLPAIVVVILLVILLFITK